MTDQPQKPKRRWFQFSLRTLLIVVTLIAGLLVAWRVYVEPYRRQLETMKLIEELGGNYKTEPGGPAWMRDWFGADNFRNIVEISLYGDMDTIVSDADLAHLKGLTNLRKLVLDRCGSDAGLAHLKGLTSLRELSLFQASVSDVGLAHLKGLTNLRTVDLSFTRVSNLAPLKGHTNLRELDLWGLRG